MAPALSARGPFQSRDAWDAAFAKFQDVKLAIREWLVAEIEKRNQRYIENRGRDGLRQLVGKHIEELKKLRLQLEGKEQAFVESELKAADQAFDGRLGKDVSSGEAFAQSSSWRGARRRW